MESRRALKYIKKHSSSKNDPNRAIYTVSEIKSATSSFPSPSPDLEFMDSLQKLLGLFHFL